MNIRFVVTTWHNEPLKGLTTFSEMNNPTFMIRNNSWLTFVLTSFSHWPRREAGATMRVVWVLIRFPYFFDIQSFSLKDQNKVITALKL